MEKGVFGYKEYEIKETDMSLKKENEVFRKVLRNIAQTPRTYPWMCTACNRARMILEEYPEKRPNKCYYVIAYYLRKIYNKFFEGD